MHGILTVDPCTTCISLQLVEEKSVRTLKMEEKKGRIFRKKSKWFSILNTRSSWWSCPRNTREGPSGRVCFLASRISARSPGGTCATAGPCRPLLHRRRAFLLADFFQKEAGGFWNFGFELHVAINEWMDAFQLSIGFLAQRFPGWAVVGVRQSQGKNVRTLYIYRYKKEETGEENELRTKPPDWL